MYRSRDVHAALKGFFKEYQFSMWRGTYYRIENDIAYCIAVEHPGLFHIHCFILPLYIPNEYVHFTYGVELRKRWNGQADMDAFLDYVKAEITGTIIPFFDSIHSPEALLSFLRQDLSIVRKMFSGPMHRCTLLHAYTALLLNKTEECLFAVTQSRSQLSAITVYSASLRQRLFDELDKLEGLCALPQSERELFFRNNVSHSLQACFPRYKPASSSGD